MRGGRLARFRGPGPGCEGRGGAPRCARISPCPWERRGGDMVPAPEPLRSRRSGGGGRLPETLRVRWTERTANPTTLAEAGLLATRPGSSAVPKSGIPDYQNTGLPEYRNTRIPEYRFSGFSDPPKSAHFQHVMGLPKGKCAAAGHDPGCPARRKRVARPAPPFTPVRARRAPSREPRTHGARRLPAAPRRSRASPGMSQPIPDQRSKRSASITLVQAATKSVTNRSVASSWA